MLIPGLALKELDNICGLGFLLLGANPCSMYMIRDANYLVYVSVLVEEGEKTAFL